MTVVLPESMCAAIPMFRTRDNRSHSTGSRFSTIFSCVNVEGSCFACSSLLAPVSPQLLFNRRHLAMPEYTKERTLVQQRTAISVVHMFSGCLSKHRSWCHWYRVYGTRQQSRARISRGLWQPFEQNNGDCLWRAIALEATTGPSFSRLRGCKNTK